MRTVDQPGRKALQPLERVTIAAPRLLEERSEHVRPWSRPGLRHIAGQRIEFG
jgi:hypothetical protein